MFRRLAWVLGLGLVGLILFGSTGGALLGGLGFVIGSSKMTGRPRAEFQSALLRVGESSTADSNPTTVSSRWLPWFWVAVGCTVVLIYWLTQNTHSAPGNLERNGEASIAPADTRSPIVSASQVWTSDKCMETHFPAAASVRTGVPPEVRIFCAYPWNPSATQALSKQLATMKLEPERVLNEISPAPAQIDLLRELMATNRSMAMPDGLLEIYDLTKVLPYLWAARTDHPAGRKSLLKTFQRSFVDDLTRVSGKIDWRQPLTFDSFTRSYRVSDDVVVYVERGTSLTAEELAQLTFGIYNDLWDKEETNPLTETLRSARQSGMHAKHSTMMVILTMFTSVLDGQASVLRESPTLPPSWQPAKNAARSAARPLELYLMRTPISGWCESGKTNVHGRYCPIEDRVMVVDDREPTLDASLGMSAPIFHELAHAYLNPTDANEYPFVTEGLATAFGERMMRATVAAAPVTSEISPHQSAAFGRIFQAPTQAEEGPPGSMHSNRERLEFARTHIQATRPTTYAEASLCRLGARPMTAHAVTTYLSRTKATFSSQGEEDMRLAYSYAWAIFNYGLDMAGTGLGAEGNQLDATIVQEAAAELAANRALNPAMKMRLDGFLAEVNVRARAEMVKWKIKCRTS